MALTQTGGYAWALANPGPIRVDLDSVDFHGIHGTAKICGFPWALASPAWHQPYTESDWVDMHGRWQTLAVPWMPWKSTLSQSTLIGLVPGFANMHIHKSLQLHYPSLPL